jgi:hypothetical protein
MRILLLIVMTALIGCSNPTNQTTVPVLPASTIPQFIKARADSFVISQVGPAFFMDYFSFDSIRSEFHEPDTFCITHPTACLEFLQHPYYQMVYRFAIPDKPWINELTEIVLDSLGSVIPESPPYGIPHCVSDSSSCSFSIDSTDAISIAQQAGLEPGIRPWRTNFGWGGTTYDTYVWTVSNTLTETSSTSSGRAVTIDSNSGVVYMIAVWMVIS